MVTYQDDRVATIQVFYGVDGVDSDPGTVRNNEHNYSFLIPISFVTGAWEVIYLLAEMTPQVWATRMNR